MTEAAALKRVAFSPGEFAALFGKSQTWGYRQIYAGKVKAITEHGRILIPAAEVEAILKTAGIYDGLKPKAAKTKAEIQSLAPRLQTAWQSFLAARRQAAPRSKTTPQAAAMMAKWPSAASGRQAALARLTGQRKAASDRR
jgi:hypothetical protein